MRTVLWTLGWIGVAVWTLFALVGFGVLGFLGDALRGISGHVPGFPDESFSAPWIANLMQRAGGLALVLVWLGGSAAILAVPAVIGLFLPRRDRDLRRHLRETRRAARFPAPGPPGGPMQPPPERRPR